MGRHRLTISVITSGLAALGLALAGCSHGHTRHGEHGGGEHGEHGGTAVAQESAGHHAEEDGEDDETPIDVAKLPAAVQAAASRTFGTLDGLRASQEIEHGAAMYEVEGKGQDGMAVSIKCVAAGQIEELERQIPVSALPADAATNLQQMFPGATVVSANAVEKHFFEVTIRQGSQSREIVVAATGRVHRGEEKSGEDEEQGEAGEYGHR